MKVKNLKNGKATGNDEAWKFYSMPFQSGVVPDGWRTVVTVTMNKAKEQSRKCKKFEGIILLRESGKIFVGVLKDRVYRA